MIVLRVESLRCRRGEREILRGVSLRVGEGESVALIGPNGAGKSTLLRHVAGVLPPPPGTVFLRGEDRTRLDPREAARRVAYVPQVRDAEIPYTGREMAAQARYPYLSVWRPHREEDRRRVERALGEVGALDYADRPFDTLSGGEQQAILIAAALAQDARLLLVDEPTTFLDPTSREAIFRVLDRARRERGLALLIVTHEVNRALLSADRIVALRDGRVVREGIPEAIARVEALEEIYGARFLLAPHPVTGGMIVLPGEYEE
ncbi:MAG: ABC transporter ATP-binding protein [Candidatus Eisenbacteria bacterium]|nr:ABC transporter ATP-binding protein [Candidatus Eisenbacteria bacterium]